MKMAHIIPPSQLKAIPLTQKIHLCLAHLVERSEVYRDYYRNKAEQGHTVILDNSAFELGEAYPAEKMFDLADGIGATEVMAPEFFMNATKTIDSICEFSELMSERGSPAMIFATICGGDINEWLRCYRAVVELTNVGTVGISFRASEFIPVPEVDTDILTKRRMEARTTLTSILARLRSPHVHHHLLGLWDPYELIMQKHHSWIRSCDSSAAYAHGIKEIEVGLDRGLPCNKESMDFEFEGEHTDLELSFVESNMKTINLMAGDV